MPVIELLGLLKDMSLFQVVVTVAILAIAVSQGWLTLKWKKEKKVPTACLHGRAGACELLRRQMEMSEVYLDKVSVAAMDHYLAMRKDRTGSEVILAMDMEAWCYDLTLYRVGRSIKATVRSFFIANHLASMNEAEFELYMHEKTDQIILVMTSIMDKLYFPGSNPSRVELYEYNQEKLMPIFHAAMEAVLRKGRQLAIQFASGELDKYMEKSDEHN